MLKTIKLYKTNISVGLKHKYIKKRFKIKQITWFKYLETKKLCWNSNVSSKCLENYIEKLDTSEFLYVNPSRLNFSRWSILPKDFFYFFICDIVSIEIAIKIFNYFF